jgi:hypothetical protein
VYDTLATWSAWYSGDADALTAVYGGGASSDPGGTGFFASERGGWRATAAARRTLQRWFHGTPASPREQRTKLHVPVASDIASTSADLLFSEPPSFAVEHSETQARLDELVDDGMHATFLEGAEVAAALGGVYLRVCWDEAIADRPWLAAVHPDAAVPEWQWGKLSAVTFWRVLAEDGARVIRHLERHERGAILHGVYEGSRDKLGHRVPLTEYPETAALAEAISDDGDTIATGLDDRLTAVYVPNMRPNRQWRCQPDAVMLGRSDYAGVEQLMDALDETMSSWQRDLRLAKARLLLPAIYLESQGRGQGARADLERELYEQINLLPDGGSSQITMVQFAIRVTEHQQTAQEQLNQILRGAGYSAQTFGLTGDTAVTATEVTARERRSFITRDRKIVYWRPALQEILETLLMVDAEVFGTTLEPARPDIEFGDSVSEDPRTLAETVDLLNRAQSASIETRVRILHPEWDDPRVAEEVAAIRAEQGIEPVTAPEDMHFDGGAPPPPPPNGELDPAALAALAAQQ